jgi:hypothetical protein
MMYDDVATPIDEMDPIYDEHQAAYILSSHEAPVTRHYDETEGKAVYGPLLTLSEFKHQVQEALLEYFDSCDSDEVIRSIEELKCREYHPEVIKKAVSISLDKHPRERELVSRLLTCMHPHPLADGDMEQGFNVLLDSLDDLSTDVPDARVSLFLFVPFYVRRAECLPHPSSLFFRQWLPTFWLELSWTKSCRQPIYRNRTTRVLVIW